MCNKNCVVVLYYYDEEMLKGCWLNKRRERGKRLKIFEAESGDEEWRICLRWHFIPSPTECSWLLCSLFRFLPFLFLFFCTQSFGIWRYFKLTHHSLFSISTLWIFPLVLSSSFLHSNTKEQKLHGCEGN